MSQRLKQNCDTVSISGEMVFSPDQMLLRFRGSSHCDLTLATCKLKEKVKTLHTNATAFHWVRELFKPLIAGHSQMALSEAKPVG